MADAIELDVRHLPAPEPLYRVLEATDRLKPGQYIHMRHRREPHLLYPQLAARGLRFRLLSDRASIYEILIWNPEDPIANQACLPE